MIVLAMRFALASLFAAGCAQGGTAGEYPDRPVKVILATGAGGTADVFARALADGFQRLTGQGLIVENRPGGQSNIGARVCIDAAPDGYTICLLPDEVMVLNQFLFKKLNYDPASDFAPITNPFFNTQVIVAATSLGVKSMTELADLSKRKPGTLSYSVMSTSMRMFMDDWGRKRGSDIVNVPVGGGSDTVTGVMTGTIPVAIVGLQNWLGYIRSGMVVPLAVNSKARLDLLPDTPTLGELGYPNEPKQFFSFVAPAKTTRPFIKKLYETIKTVGEEPKFRKERISDQGLEPVFDDPESFTDFLASERVKARDRFANSGIELR